VAADAQIGDSIAVDGVCLTVTGRQDGTLTFDLSDETLEVTTFGRERNRSTVNLERPVTLLTRLGGHLVQGHVDGVGTVRAVEPEGDGARMTVEVPDGLDRYLVDKGSVTVDGVSLTVASLGEETFDVSLIPHTLAVTTLGERAPGDPVNLEVDVLAKYVDRLIRRTG
jgi:riboflavin synthase